MAVPNQGTARGPKGTESSRSCASRADRELGGGRQHHGMVVVEVFGGIPLALLPATLNRRPLALIANSTHRTRAKYKLVEVISGELESGLWARAGCTYLCQKGMGVCWWKSGKKRVEGSFETYRSEGHRSKIERCHRWDRQIVTVLVLLDLHARWRRR